MSGCGLARIRAGSGVGGGGVTTNLGQCEGGHEEIDIQQGGCLILQFCFIFKEMR